MLSLRKKTRGLKKGRGVKLACGLYVAIVIAGGFAIAAIACEPHENIGTAYQRLAPAVKFGIPMLLGSVVFGPFVQSLFERYDSSGQVSRDAEASKILESLESGVPLKYAVYLRSFWLDGNCPTNYSEYSGSMAHSLGLRAPARSFGFVLADAISDEMPLIGIGHTDGELGIGRIESSDASWKEKVRVLCQRAANVYIAPLATEGTRWEMEFLKEKGLLPKTVFIMPPAQTSLFKESELARRWNEARQFYSEVGLNLPAFNDIGAVFRLTADGDCRVVAEGFIDDPPGLQKALSALASGRGRMISRDPPSISECCPKCKSTRSRRREDSLRVLSFARVCQDCGAEYRRPASFGGELVNSCTLFVASLVVAAASAGIFMAAAREYQSVRRTYGNSGWLASMPWTVVAIGLIVGLLSVGLLMGAANLMYEAFKLTRQKRVS